MSSRARTIVLRVALALAATAGALVAAELTLHALREPDRFYPNFPNTVYVHGPFDPKITLGVEGYARFTTNRFGCRGSDPGNQERRLLVVGGSTVNCIDLDDTEAWPQIVMDEVNRRVGDPEALWVTASGKEGRSTRHHVMHARYLVPKIPGLDHVLYYCGLNDVAKWMREPVFVRGYLDDEARWNDAIGEAFHVSDFHDPTKRWYKDLELNRLCRRVALFFKEKMFELSNAEYVIDEDYQSWMEAQRRERRERGRVRIEGPKLATFPGAGEEYEDNLRRMIRWTRAAGAEPIFMAQYVDLVDVSPEELEHQWGTDVDGGAFGESQQLEGFVGDFNARMQRVAEEEHVVFIDLPALLAGQKRLCHDGVHFNEAGSRVVAEVVAQSLIEHVYR
jgi:lysophospholipase L1-like esterase